MGSRDYLEGVRSTADALMPAVDVGGARRDVELAGGHDDLLREPNVSDVARVLDLALGDPADLSRRTAAHRRLTDAQRTPGCNPVTR